MTDSLDSLGSRDSTTQKSVNEDKKSRTAVSQVKRESENYASPRPIENEHIICYDRMHMHTSFTTINRERYPPGTMLCILLSSTKYDERGILGKDITRSYYIRPAVFDTAPRRIIVPVPVRVPVPVPMRAMNNINGQTTIKIHSAMK